MDPNATLELIREACADALALLDTGEGPDAVELLGRYKWELRWLAESVDALDSWLSRGGFLPGAWSR